jgi:hypothetical protein
MGNLWLVCAFRESARSMIHWTLHPAIAQLARRSSNFFQLARPFGGGDGDSGREGIHIQDYFLLPPHLLSLL